MCAREGTGGGAVVLYVLSSVFSVCLPQPDSLSKHNSLEAGGIAPKQLESVSSHILHPKPSANTTPNLAYNFSILRISTGLFGMSHDRPTHKISLGEI